jgi:hypothetical protein
MEIVWRTGNVLLMHLASLCILKVCSCQLGVV